MAGSIWVQVSGGTEGGGDCLWFTSNCTVHCRQAYRTLHQLLGYDPTGVPPGQPGYGSGSGAPDIMFGFLKHLWATHSRQDALARYSLRCNGTQTCTRQLLEYFKDSENIDALQCVQT